MAAIRNPIEWGWAQLKNAAGAAGSVGHAMHGPQEIQDMTLPVVRRITIVDLGDALRRGFEDFGACRTDVIFLCIIYPIAGLALSRLMFGYEVLPLLFPLAAGFALLGPAAAVGLYEMSRRRERGAEVNWAAAFRVLGSPSYGALVALGLILLGVFLLWLLAAQVIYTYTLGPEAPASLEAFVHDIFTTSRGWAMIGVGVGVGFLFAVLVLTISVVSFPLLLDRDVGLVAAVGTSVRAVMRNPAQMAVWGGIVAGSLVIGSIPLFLGLIVVMPVLGHATWHLYRKLVPR